MAASYYPAIFPLFSNHLNLPWVIDATLGSSFVMQAVQVNIDMGLGLAPTPLWVYELVDAVTGQPVMNMNQGMSAMSGMNMDVAAGVPSGIYNPIFLASSNVPLTITWSNQLPVGNHLLPFDPSLMMANMGSMSMGGTSSTAQDAFMVPIVTHLHGQHSAAIYDGYPSSTIMPGKAVTYNYDNSQPGALLWYHDHSLGMTRLNVYAGLAGMYMIQDQNRLDLVTKGVLPGTLGAFDVPLIIQDKAFNADGTLYYPAYPTDVLPGTTDTVGGVLPPDYTALGGQFPTAVPEFFGDTILVNGEAWPHAHVGQGEVMFDLVNGSDSRFYLLQLDNPNVKITLLGVDGGLLEHPIVVMDGDGVQEQGEQIVFAPGDRLQLLIDFSNIKDGEKVHLTNAGSAYEPFKGLNPDGTVAIATSTTGADPVSQIMEFRVLASEAAFHSTMTADTVLNANYKSIEVTSDTITRKLGVFEYADQFGRIMPVVGIAEDAVNQTGAKIAAGGLGWAAPATEIVKLGATEIWEFYNVTADAHPIHLHQVQFQVLGRYEISSSDANGDNVILQGEQAYQNDLGKPIPLYPEDLGNQDTVWLGPGEALKVIATFDRPGDYVWHCHILSHEDNDMMRPIKVIGFSGDTTGMVAEDSAAPANGLLELGTLDNALQGFKPGPIVGHYGTLLLNQDGNWSYAVDNANPLVQSLGQGKTVDDVLTVTELDGKTTHAITVEVIGREDAPTGTLAFSAHDNVDSVLLTANQNIFDLDLASLSNVLGKVDDNQLTYSWEIATGTASAQMAGASAVITSTTGSLVSLTASYDDGTRIETMTSAFSNLIVGSSASADTLTGADKPDGKGGTISDVIFGVNGNDIINGGVGSDVLVD